MKKIFYSLFVCLVFSVIVYGQAPNAFKYQAVVRDVDGKELISQPVSLRFAILQGSASGTSVYSETVADTTNEFGLVTVNIGDGGISHIGSFSGISWGSDIYFLKVEIDAAGGSSFSLLGITQLLSVPYALSVKHFKTPGTSANTFIGKNAGDSLSSGVSNTFVGSNAGKIINSALSNVFIGSNSGSQRETGNGNVLIGSLSGRESAGDYNIFIGTNAGYFETGSNKLYIQNIILPSADSSEALIYGDFSAKYVQINDVLRLRPSTPPLNPVEGMIYYSAENHCLMLFGQYTWHEIYMSTPGPTK